MNNAELIKALKDAEMYLNYVAPRCYASFEVGKAIRAAADALEAADKRIAELEAKIPKEGEWRWNSLLNEYEWVDTTIYCPNCGARMSGCAR